jgi:BNR/Asp-box repeat.
MKKALLLSLILTVGMTGFTQRIIVKKGDFAKQKVLASVINYNEQETPAMNFQSSDILPKASRSRSTRSYDEFSTMITQYDLQTNSSLGNRIALWDDGTAAVVATWDNSQSSTFANRGTGYNYYDGSSFGEEPTTRIETDKSGWPSIAPLGDGEIIASHASGVQLHSRAIKGEGEWVSHGYLNGNTYHWPRICTSGPDNQIIHLLMAHQDASNTLLNYVYYTRSSDGGETWSDLEYPPLVDLSAAGYNFNIGADDYVMASNGNDIAILFGGLTYDIFYIISHDNGETWEKQVVAAFPYENFDWNQTAVTSATDSIWWDDNSHSIAIDDNGTVHVAFGLTRWAPAPESGAGYYTYWPYTDAIVYWNSEYVNEQGGHEIPAFGLFSEDANHPEWQLNGTNGCASILNEDRIMALAEANGHNNLTMFGWPDETGDGIVDYTEYWDQNTVASYRSLGIATMPSISIDEQGNMAIIYNVLSESRVEGTSNFYYRSAYMTYRDKTGTWFYDAQNLCEDFIHSLDEVYSTVACANAQNGSFWVAYSADPMLGLYLDENQSDFTDNVIYAVKVTPDLEGWNVGEAVNPLTNVKVYPNPAVETLNIEINASQASDVHIDIYNITGQKVAEENLAALSIGINARQISISNLTTGVYFVTVKANGFEETQKLVVK